MKDIDGLCNLLSNYKYNILFDKLNKFLLIKITLIMKLSSIKVIAKKVKFKKTPLTTPIAKVTINKQRKRRTIIRTKSASRHTRTKRQVKGLFYLEKKPIKPIVYSQRDQFE